MHTVWKGSISFGLVNIPVKMYSATEDKDISMKMLHKDCGTPLTNIRNCPTCKNEVAWDDVVKGYEYEKNRFVVFDKEELDVLAGENDKHIHILDFISQGEVDPVYFQKTYYLGPDEIGTKAYSLLLQALTLTKKVAIAKVTIRSKTNLSIVRFKDNCLLLETIHYNNEVRCIDHVPNLPEPANVNQQELDLAVRLVEHLTTSFEPDKYKDDYRDRLTEVIQKKITGEQVTIVPAAKQANVMDFGPLSR